jgi:hypothetical protein
MKFCLLKSISERWKCDSDKLTRLHCHLRQIDLHGNEKLHAVIRFRHSLSTFQHEHLYLTTWHLHSELDVDMSLFPGAAYKPIQNRTQS